MPLLSLLILILSVCAVLVAASLFTNGIEWLGKRLNLSVGAVGSVLAAVGTALPEAMIPIVAVLSGHEDSAHVGIGAILGAPFMLSTLAFLVVGLSARLFKQRQQGPIIRVDATIFQRDMRFFLIVFTGAAAVSFVPWQGVRYLVAILLVLLYINYVYKTLRDGEKMGENSKEINALFLARKVATPAKWLIILQLLISLGLMVVGARFFVNAIIDLAHAFNLSTLLLSLIITPVATELPEKFNSIFWMRDGKDTLALGNITGAMVFQSSVVPSFGIAFTSWDFTIPALVSVVLALLSAFIAYYCSVRREKLTANSLIFSGSFYLLFIVYVLLSSWYHWPVH